MNIDFIGIGAPRSGSTWIYKCLKEHPEVCMSEPKETNFFMGKDITNLDLYFENFSHCPDSARIRGEFSPRYIFDPRALENIKKFLPDTKIIISLRNPITRIESRINYSKAKGVFSDRKKSAGDILDEKLYLIKRNEYFRLLKPVFDMFPPQNILVMLYEDLVNKPEAFIKDIYSFLDIDTEYTPSRIQKPANRARDKKLLSTTTQNFLRKLKYSGAQSTVWQRNKKLLKKIKVHQLVNIPMRANEKIGSILKNDQEQLTFTESERKKIRTLLEKDIQKLEHHLGRSLDVWR